MDDLDDLLARLARRDPPAALDCIGVAVMAGMARRRTATAQAGYLSLAGGFALIVGVTGAMLPGAVLQAHEPALVAPPLLAPSELLAAVG